jgi:hypothetical protein
MKRVVQWVVLASVLSSFVLLPATALAEAEPSVTVDQLLTLIAEQKWFAVVGAVIGIVAYAVSRRAEWCPINLTDKARALLATLLSGLATAVGAAVGWTSLGNALFAFMLSGIPTILLFVQELLSESKAAKAAVLKIAPPALLGLVLLSGCSATCPIIHAADEICPYLVVELADGSKERVPCRRVRAMAAEQRAARMGVDSADGGAQ